VTHMAITTQFFLWSQITLLWALLSYGVGTDPLPEDVGQGKGFAWKSRAGFLAARAAIAALIAFAMSHSLLVVIGVLVGIAFLPYLRRTLSSTWTTAVEVCCPAAFLGYIFWVIEHFKLSLHWDPIELPLTAEHLSALCITLAIFLMVVRGGTYMVKGLLKLADVLPQKNSAVDEKEVSRGRLIGNVERLILTFVTAAGSYAALGFLIAAKGFVRAKEFEDPERNRDFTEYFLVGSLASVLIALIAGLIIRFALLALWPELLSLQMQSS
jgi:hypothetical protein